MPSHPPFLGGKDVLLVFFPYHLGEAQKEGGSSPGNRINLGHTQRLVKDLKPKEEKATVRVSHLGYRAGMR